MKLNNIQKQIYEEYKRTGKVWAECPRHCGKTELLIFIAEEEMKKGNKVFIESVTLKSRCIIIEKIKKLRNLIVDSEKEADVILYDEVYYDVLKKWRNHNKKIVCLRTRVHPLLKFNYRDLDGDDVKWYPDMDRLRKEMPKEQFELEYE